MEISALNLTHKRLSKVLKILFTETLSCWVYILVKAKDEMLALPMLDEYRFHSSVLSVSAFGDIGH